MRISISTFSTQSTHRGLSHQVAIGRNLTSTSVSDWLNDGGASNAAVYSKGLLPVTFPLLKNGPLRRVLQSQGIENERSVARFYLEVDGARVTLAQVAAFGRGPVVLSVIFSTLTRGQGDKLLR